MSNSQRDKLTSLLGMDGPRSVESDLWVRFLVGSLFFGFVLCSVFALIICTHVFPLTEGWYESIVYLNERGRETYRDVDFVLPPMTMAFYHFMHATIGNGIAAHKIFGVLFTILISFLVGIFAARKSGVYGGAFASFFYILLTTTFATYLPRDYHQILDFFLVLALTVLFDRQGPFFVPGSLKTVFMSGLGGALTMAAFATKQNVGLLLWVAVTLALSLAAGFSFLAGRRRAGGGYLLNTGAFGLGSALAALLIYLALGPDMTIGEFYGQFLSVESKGSPLYVGLRILHDNNNVIIIRLGIIISSLSLLVVAISVKMAPLFSKHLKNQNELIRDACKFIALSASCFAFWRFFIRGREVWTNFDFITTLGVAALIMDCILLVGKSVRQRGVDIPRWGRVFVFGALLYANTLTAALNVVGIGMLIAYYGGIGFLAFVGWLRRADVVWVRVSVLACVLIIGTLVVRFETDKLGHPYSWWGISEDAAYRGTTQSSAPLLAGLKLSPYRVMVIDHVISDIREITHPGDPIFAYPNIPIFYPLTDRLPPTKSAIQWFDVVTESALENDFLLLLRSPPKAIVEMTLPEFVYAGHQQLLGRSLLQKSFSDYLNCMVDRKAFVVIREVPYQTTQNDEYTFRLDAAHSLDGSTIVDLVALLHARGVKVKIITAGSADIQRPVEDLVKAAGQIVTYSSLIVQGRSEDIRRAAELWGAEGGAVFERVTLQSDFTIRVLKRSESWSALGEPCATALQGRIQAAKTDGL